jgi:T5SS/PEP-CTERM-associated repeat protein/autotransporter-associated beta strand protein
MRGIGNVAVIVRLVSRVGIFSSPEGAMRLSPATRAAGATRPASFWFVLLTGLSLVGEPSFAHAAITPVGDVSPVLPWDGATLGYIGMTSAGTLTVDGGSDLDCNGGTIGDGSGATGVVNVAGSGSTWFYDSLSVGNFGSGTLSISGGGAVQAAMGVGYAEIAGGSGSTGIVSVDGAGSFWSTPVLVVGYAGTATLSITNGGSVSNSSVAKIGYGSGSSGAVTVDGPGSKWTANIELKHGTLNISNGGRIESGGHAEVDSVATIDGSGSSWTISGSLQISNGYDDGEVIQTDGNVSIGVALTLGDAGTGPAIGTYNLNGGTLIVKSLQGSGGTAVFNFGGGVLQSSGSFISNTHMTLTGVGGNATIDTNGYEVTLTGVVSGTAGLLTTGSGTLTLTGSNTFTGGTTVTEGTLALSGGNNRLNNAGNITVAGGTLALGGYSQDVFGSVILSAGTIQNGTLTKLGGYFDARSGTISAVLASLGSNNGLIKTTAGTVTLTAANTYTGGTTVNGGTLMLAGGNNRLAIGRAITVLNGVLDLGGYSQETSGSVILLGGGAESATIQNGTLKNNGGAFDFRSGTVSAVLANGASAAALAKTTSGTLTLSGVNTYSGGTDIAAGVVSFGNGSLGTAGNILFSGNATLQWNGTNTQDVSSQLRIDDGVAATLDMGNNTVTLANNIGRNGAGGDGTGAVNKVGSGTLILSAANTYTGGTTVGAGTLTLSGGNNRLATTGGITVAGGVLDLGGNSQETSGSVLLQGGVVENGTLKKNGGYFDVRSGTVNAVLADGTSAAGLTKSTSGTVTLTQSSTYTGDTTVNAGMLKLDAATFAMHAISGAGDLGVGGTGSAALTADSVNVGKLTLGVSAGGSGTYIQSGAATVSANYEYVGFFGSGVFTQSGGTNTVSNGLYFGSGFAGCNGTYNLNGGALILNSLVKNSGTATFNFGGGTLQASGTMNCSLPMTLTGTGGNANVDANGYAVALSGVLSGVGGLTTSGAGTLTLAAANIYGGVTTVNAGALAYGVDNAIRTGDVTVNGGTLSLGAYSDSVGAVALAGGAIVGTTGTLTSTSGFTVSSGSISAVLAGAVPLTKTGSGTVTLSKPTTYTGLTTVSAGRLAYGVNDAISTGDVMVNGGTLSLGAYSDSVGVVTLASGVIVSGTLTSTGGFQMQSGSANARLAGGVGLRKTTTGIVILGTTNSYSGTTTVDGGILVAARLASLPGYNLAGSVSVASGAAAGGYVGSGASGFWTEANFATLRSNANWAPGAALAIDTSVGAYTYTSAINNGGSAGTVSIGVTKLGANKLTLNGANTYTGRTTLMTGTLELGPAAQNCVFNLGGADIQSGKMVFDYSSGISPAATILDLLSDSYDGGLWDVGQFRMSNVGSTGLTLGWSDNLAGERVTVMATYPGDFNLDGVVDVWDKTIIREHIGGPGTWATGDANYDGFVNLLDWNLWKWSVGLPALALGSSMAGVPEPGTLALLAIGLVGLLAYGRRRRATR